MYLFILFHFKMCFVPEIKVSPIDFKIEKLLK